jgi:hypothetical protein
VVTTRGNGEGKLLVTAGEVRAGEIELRTSVYWQESIDGITVFGSSAPLLMYQGTGQKELLSFSFLTGGCEGCFSLILLQVLMSPFRQPR